MVNNIKVSAIQMASSPNIDANLLEVERLVKEAAQEGSKLIVLPESFAFIGHKDNEILAIQEPLGHGQLQNFLSELAMKYRIWLIGGTIPIAIEGANNKKVRSTTLVYDNKGKLVGHYNKMHLFDVQLLDINESYSESTVIEPGSSPLVIDTPFGKLGIAVCYDLRFPELFRMMLDKGLNIIAVPSAFTAVTGKAHWEILVRARAIENLCYVIAAAQGGYHISGRETYGHSMIIDPWGTILKEVPRGGTGYAISKLDLKQLQVTRTNFPALKHRCIYCR